MKESLLIINSDMPQPDEHGNYYQFSLRSDKDGCAVCLRRNYLTTTLEIETDSNGRVVWPKESHDKR